MNFNSCLIWGCWRVFPAVAHTQDHYLTKWLWGPLRAHGWWKNMNEFMVTPLPQATLTESDLHIQTHLWPNRGETPVLHLLEVEQSRALYLGVIRHFSCSQILLCSSLWHNWKRLKPRWKSHSDFVKKSETLDSVWTSTSGMVKERIVSISVPYHFMPS